MAHQGRQQRQHGNRQGVGRQGCTETCEGEMVSEQDKLHPQIPEGQNSKQGWNQQAAWQVTAGQMGPQQRTSVTQPQGHTFRKETSNL